ncbi:Clp protease N-terminal domain-containing protein [Amycolatopsis lexingtonensis]|uniref:Clp protease N-terminal domain-containing protein n=1 Tax=Amycolatopsis lexingtonensis TaxID=218822 RepID=UPI003F6E5A1B
MFERFTQRARRVVVLAQEEARMLNHNYIGTEHLLLALSHEGEAGGARAIESAGVTYTMIRDQIAEIIGLGARQPEGHIPFTPRTKKVLELSLRESMQLGQTYIATEHLLLGLIREGEGVGAQVLAKLDVKLIDLRKRTTHLLPGQKNDTAIRDDRERAESVHASTANRPSKLDELGRSLSKLACDDALDPTIGRVKEIDRLVQILSRRTRHNPVLVGEHGVGKTAIFDGLAQRIATGQVPERLKDKEIHVLDHVGREGGDRLREALAEVRARDDVILLLDDLSDLVHGKHAEVLSAAVLHGDLLVGCTATPESYRLVNTESPALAQLFQPIQVTEMSADTAVEVLRVIRGRLADHHHLVIEDEVLSVAVELAARYDRQHRLPRSAIDLIDESCARATGSANLSEADLSRTMQDLRNEWKAEAQLLGALQPAFGGYLAKPVPEAFLRLYGGVDTEIWRIG